MRQLKIQSQTSESNLPKLGVLTQIDEVTRYDLVYIYHLLKTGDELTIEKDLERTWDDQALVVLYKGYKLGYVSRKTSELIARKLKNGFNITATIRSVLKHKFNPFASVDIQVCLT